MGGGGWGGVGRGGWRWAGLLFSRGAEALEGEEKKTTTATTIRIGEAGWISGSLIGWFDFFPFSFRFSSFRFFSPLRVLSCFFFLYFTRCSFTFLVVVMVVVLL